jgi:hypothetical protein
VGLTRFPAVRRTVNLIREGLRLIRPTGRRQVRELRAKRHFTDERLAELCGKPDNPFAGDVLVDAQWDNPNYWLRLSLLRAAIGLPNAREVGILGKYARTVCARTLSTFGVREQVVFDHIPFEASAVRKEAERLVAATRSAGDILDWALPDLVPGHIVYDGILKRQRLASVDISRNDFLPLVIEALTSIHQGRYLLDRHDFKLAVISHPIGFTCGILAHQALIRRIPVLLPFGLFGVLRFTHMTRPEDLTAFYDRPTRKEMESLTPARADALRVIGQRYLARRFQGHADDLASVYAYRLNQSVVGRNDICQKFGWDPAKPIVAFYASNWFDWPHQLGMTQFRDFLDWTEASFAAAASNSSVNWLFKPHPCEDWFGGISLDKILARLDCPSHIGIADKRWNNTSVMEGADALVTYHGTAGIEFAALGKPVLVPDRGKYDDCGFVKVARNRNDYLQLLASRWWDDMDVAECKVLAEVFSGWWFCAPAWQGQFVLSDDSRQHALYDSIPTLLSNNINVVHEEIRQLADWYASGHRYSHTWKMMHSDTFQLTNV